jgi:hypothetical protein
MERTAGTHTSTKLILRKAILIALVVLCFSCIGTLNYLDGQYYRTRPREPDVKAGRTYPKWVHHGTLVYLTHSEKAMFDWLPFICPVFALTAFALNQRWKVFGNSGSKL